ncbi:hypothetical protein COSO111634_31780 [Corallococcus soli]
MIRAAVAASKRSLRYSKATWSPRGVSVKTRVKSNLDAPLSTSRVRKVRPGPVSSATGVLSSTSVTWKKGVWPAIRGGCSASTSFSNGTSWCAYAPSVTAFTRRSSSTKDGSPSNCVRSTSVLTKKPMSPSVCGWLRPAMGAPMLTSSCPV